MGTKHPTNIRQTAFPRDTPGTPQGHAELAMSLNNLGSVLRKQGEHARAEEYLRQALEMTKRLYSADRYPQGHLDMASGLNNMGSVVQSQGKYALAAEYYRQSLAMHRRRPASELVPEER